MRATNWKIWFANDIDLRNVLLDWGKLGPTFCRTKLSVWFDSVERPWQAYKMVCWPAKNASFYPSFFFHWGMAVRVTVWLRTNFKSLPFAFSTSLSRNLSYLCLGGLYFYPWLRKVGAWVGWWWASMGACSDNNNANQHWWAFMPQL